MRKPYRTVKTKRILIYGRVSTADQRHDSQIAEVQEYVHRRWGDNATVTVITDTASGTRSSRQGLDRVMNLVRRNKVDILVCFKLDRLGRSLPHLAQIISEFDQHNVGLVVTSQGVDTCQDSPAGRLQMHVLAAVAEFERSLIIERVRAGQAAARARGVKFGRPGTLLQYLPRVRALREAGRNVSQIARELSMPYASAHKLARLCVSDS
jgi:DNA invertase Pin-like site-specific DNA recombinase